MKNIINTSKAPKAIGPYSQAIEVNNTLFVSGQIPINPQTGEIVDGGIIEQTHQVMQNIGNILDAADYDYGDVVKVTCFLTEINDFAEMNKVYDKYYPQNAPPARSVVQVAALPRGVQIKIETIAAK